MPDTATNWTTGTRHQRLRSFSQSIVAAIYACALVAAFGGGCAKRQSPPRGSPRTHPESAGVGARGYIAVSQVPATVPSGKLMRAGVVEPASGGRIVLVDVATSELVSVLTEGFTSAGKPDCSFDGKRILFVGAQRGQDAPAVWEIGIDGEGLRRVTDCPGGCARAIYLSTIYTIDATAPEDQIAFVTLPTRDAPSTIYTCRLDGTRAHPIAFAPKGASDPTLLSDGRLVFSMAAPVGDGFRAEGDVDNTALFTINTDGTDVFPFAGLHGEAASRTAPCQIDDDTVAYSECDEAGCDLVLVSRTRSLHSRRVVRSIAGERIRALAPMPERRVLVSHSTVGRADTSPSQLSVLDMNDWEITATLLGDSVWHALDAVWVGPRLKPPGRSSAVNHDDSVARLYGLNVYLSGRTVHSRRDSAIEKIQVFTKSLSPGDVTDPQLLGEARVESDGSFFIELPARVPLQLTSIARDGKVVDRMRSFFWVMPGERRGCIGCHEDREMTPPNRHVFALRRPAQRIGPFPVTRAENAKPYRSGDGSR